MWDYIITTNNKAKQNKNQQYHALLLCYEATRVMKGCWHPIGPPNSSFLVSYAWYMNILRVLCLPSNIHEAERPATESKAQKHCMHKGMVYYGGKIDLEYSVNFRFHWQHCCSKTTSAKKLGEHILNMNEWHDQWYPPYGWDEYISHAKNNRTEVGYYISNLTLEVITRAHTTRKPTSVAVFTFQQIKPPELHYLKAPLCILRVI